MVFGVVLIIVLIGGRQRLLNDPGTFWHLKLGQEIRDTGVLPTSNTLTRAADGDDWIDQSWAFDLALAVVVEKSGWSGALAISALMLAAIYAGLARGLLRDGRSVFAAVSVSVLAAGIGSVHFLLRPHIFTFVFVVWTLRACQLYHEGHSQRIWALPIVMVAWANLHGGFLAGPLILGTAALGHAVSGPWNVDRRRRLAGFGAILALAVLAPLVNPYGIHLYDHVLNLLIHLDITDLIDEYQPVAFGSPESRLLEFVLLVLVALPVFSRTRPTRYELAHLLVWLHLALGSIRHAPLFAFAMAGGLARLIDGLPEREAGDSAMTSRSESHREAGAERDPGRRSVYPILASLLLLLAVSAGIPIGSHDPGRWPFSALPALASQPVEAPLFHEQDWGGLIALECHPARLAFLDDRFELYGRRGILEYVSALKGGPGWDAITAEHDFELVWLRPDRGLARRLSAEESWQEVFRDKVSVLFRKVGSEEPDRFGIAEGEWPLQNRAGPTIPANDS
ncbi:hypothetical protein BH23PLA1_BH23PLA1_45220 [soil metagenome]